VLQRLAANRSGCVISAPNLLAKARAAASALMVLLAVAFSPRARAV